MKVTDKETDQSAKEYAAAFDESLKPEAADERSEDERFGIVAPADEEEKPAVIAVVDESQNGDATPEPAVTPEPIVAEPEAAASAEGEAAVTAEPMTPEEKHKQASWEGRLAKREQELAAREAALASKEVGGAAVATPAEEAAEGEPAVAATVKEETGEGEPDEEKEHAELMARFAGDLGPEFSRLHELAQKKVVGSLNKRIDELVGAVQDGFRMAHMNAIADAHEDAATIIDSEPYQKWRDALPDDKKAAVDAAMKNGSAGKVIRVLNDFKAALNAPAAEPIAAAETKTEPEPEEVAAAEAVRSTKSGSRLPSRPGMSDMDNYKSGWDMA